jgi:hypothetical protein
MEEERDLTGQQQQLRDVASGRSRCPVVEAQGHSSWQQLWLYLNM